MADSLDDQVRAMTGREPRDGDIIEVDGDRVVNLIGPNDYAEVPLVIDIDGEKKVVGRAVVQGSEVLASFDKSEEAQAILQRIFSDMTEGFSMGFTRKEEREEHPLLYRRLLENYYDNSRERNLKHGTS